MLHTNNGVFCTAYFIELSIELMFLVDGYLVKIHTLLLLWLAPGINCIIGRGTYKAILLPLKWLRNNPVIYGDVICESYTYALSLKSDHYKISCSDTRTYLVFIVKHIIGSKQS